MLLRTQRNQIFELINSKGLNPSDFTENNSGSITYTLRHKPEPYYFNIDRFTDYYGIKCFPVTKADEGSRYTWASVLRYLDTWANIVKIELDVPDLWKEFANNSRIFISIDVANEEKFSDKEIRALQGQLRLLTQNIQSASLPENAKQALIGTIGEAPAKAERFTKKEWQGWFLGAIVAQVTNLALSPEHVSTVYQLLKSTFSTLLLGH